jgi:hypothetical protein
MKEQANIKLQQLQATTALKAEAAQQKLAIEALKLENTAQNEETKRTIEATTKAKEADSKKEPQQPMVVNVVMPKGRKKKVKLSRDEVGNIVGEATEEDEAEMDELMKEMMG